MVHNYNVLRDPVTFSLKTEKKEQCTIRSIPDLNTENVKVKTAIKEKILKKN